MWVDFADHFFYPVAPEAGVPRRVQRREVEGEVYTLPAVVIGGNHGGVEQENLADHHAVTVVLVKHGPQALHNLVGAVVVIERGVGDGQKFGWVVDQVAVFAEGMEHVHAEPVDPPIHPEPEHVVHGGHHRRVSPVQIWLLGEEEVEIPLVCGGAHRPRGLIFGPGLDPVVRGRAIGGLISPHIPVPMLRGP